MAESNNGVNIAPENRGNSSVEAVDSPNLANGSKPSLSETEFRAFIPFPHVRLERHDITPYLNRLKQPAPKKPREKKRGKNYDIHAQRLSQECFVLLKNDDLEQLKAALKRARSLSVSSESEAGNPDMAVKCNICEKSYNSEKKLVKHQKNKHLIFKTPSKNQKRVTFSDQIIIHEVPENHNCRKCPKFFEDYKSLKRHMRLCHKKRKCYICNYCNKKFVDRMFFKVHIRLHCDVCGSSFSKRSKYLEHRRDVCRVFKLYKCKTCLESFFKIMDLKDHSYEHLDPCYVCDICKEQFHTKCSIAHHFSFLHSQKSRPKELYVMRKMGTERLYLCEFCDESSVERNVIESHVLNLPDLSNKATMGYKDYYFCDQCMKQFDTETDMLQHKWTHFLKTSDNSQTRPKSILTKKPQKIFYNINEEIPAFLKPYIILDRVEYLRPTEYIEFAEVNEVATYTANPSDVELSNPEEIKLKKPIVDPKSRKTILSKHQCETCGKYFSNNYCLNRHIATQHEDFENLKCKVCEETFVWPSLLKSHKCIRLNHPEMPFDDARAEILFDNFNLNMNQNGFDDLNIIENDDYMNVVDFEIPAPAVELRECDSTYMQNLAQNEYVLPDKNGVTSSGYKLVMQEVPIEF